MLYVILLILNVSDRAEGDLSAFRGFSMFGFTWVPWFFMLSGYILTVAENKSKAKKTRQQQQQQLIANKNTDDGLSAGEKSSDRNNIEASASVIFQYVFRRLQAVYPIYVVGIAAAIATVWAIDGRQSLQSPSDVLIYLMLLQSWVPSVLERGLKYLVQCWFLSCLVLYWVLFHRLHNWISSLDSKSFFVVVFIVVFCIPFTYQMAILNRPTWYGSHEYGSTDTGVDIAVVVLKYHPLAYLHIFVLGMCLVRARIAFMDALRSISRGYCIIPFISLIMYGALAILFCCGGETIPSFKLSLRLGLIAALQSGVLIGLSNKEDVLTKVFSHPVLMKFGKYSIVQYIFQFIVYQWYSYATSNHVVDIWYFLLLFATSVVIGTLLNIIAQRNMNKVLLMVASCLFIMYLMLQPLLSTYSKKESSNVPHTESLSWWADELLNVEDPFNINVGE